MNEPKPLATLSSGLLARKGQAQPAMRRQTMMGVGFEPATPQSPDDLGWNDMGPEATSPQPIRADLDPVSADAAPPPVVQQQRELARELTVEAIAAPLVRAAPGSKGKAAFTLRLDPGRHLKLRLVCAVQHRSAQHIVVAALDAFLDAHETITDLAGSVARTRN